LDRFSIVLLKNKPGQNIILRCDTTNSGRCIPTLKRKVASPLCTSLTTTVAVSF